jgi:hypothetical protein
MLLSILVLHVLLLGLVLSQDRQVPQDDLADSSSSPPLVFLRAIHATLVADYDCKDSAPPQSQPGAGTRAGSPQLAARVFAATGGRPSLSCATQQATGSSRPRPCGERTPPTLLSPPSRHNAASRTRFSSTGGRFRSLSRRWRSHAAQSSSASAGRGASSALSWTRCCRRRWEPRASGRRFPQACALVQAHVIALCDAAPPQG